MVSKVYPLEKINDAFDDMRAGRNLRGILAYPPLDSATSSPSGL